MESDTWLGVELRHLAALQAIAEHGSFGRAAEALGYTQSAVSQQLATLEKLVGQRLVDRPAGQRPAELTEAGRMLLAHADAIVARLRAARADLSALADGAPPRPVRARDPDRLAAGPPADAARLSRDRPPAARGLPVVHRGTPGRG